MDTIVETTKKIPSAPEATRKSHRSLSKSFTPSPARRKRIHGPIHPDDHTVTRWGPGAKIVINGSIYLLKHLEMAWNKWVNGCKWGHTATAATYYWGSFTPFKKKRWADPLKPQLKSKDHRFACWIIGRKKWKTNKWWFQWWFTLVQSKHHLKQTRVMSKYVLSIKN